MRGQQNQGMGYIGCVFTVAGVFLFQGLRGITSALGIGFAAWLFGIVFTIVGIVTTFIFGSNGKEKGIALLIDVILWLLKGLIGWVLGVAIAFFLIYYYHGGGRKQQTREENEESGPMTLDRLPGHLYSPQGIDYRCYANYGYGVEYVNAVNPNDRILITNIESYTGSEIHTNAGSFFIS
ncbi:hypothetical protein AALB16_02190 [Lachnospiraceae bacterium 62-35]